MAQFVVPVVVAEGENVPPDPQALLGRAQALEIPPAVDTLDALKGTLSHLAPEGSSFSILRSFPFGNLWRPFEGDLPTAPVLYVRIEQPRVSHVTYSPTPVRTSKKQKFAVFQGKTKRVPLSVLVGEDAQYGALAALNWLGLHLYGASESLEVFLRNPGHERRYYPYARALFKAAAGGTGIGVAGLDGATSDQPDIQLIVGPTEVVPADVKTGWGYGSINDPDGIYRNAETLDQLLRYVLKYNESKENSYTVLTSVIAGLEYIFFFKFHIEKTGRGNGGALTMLEHAPGFSTGGLGIPATAGLAPVHLLDMDSLVQGKSAHHTFEDILPKAAPAGFRTLVAFLRKLARQDTPVVLQYITTDGMEDTAKLSELLAYGSKSCIFSTQRGDTVVKVSSPVYIDIERKEHVRIDCGGCPYLRKMVGYGSVLGIGPELVFLELDGLGLPFAPKHVSSAHALQKCWKEASVAVEFMHQKHVFHRDIKPDNFIMLDTGKASERLVLNDFDCAAHWEEGDLSQDVGTHMFRSPLQEDCDYYRCCDDWLSLGLSFASVMGLYRCGLDNSKKIAVLEGLVTHAWAPEDLKNRIKSALYEQTCCCS